MSDGIVSNGIDPMTYALPAPMAAAVAASLAEWQAHGKAQRLWRISSEKDGELQAR